ncbi:hypothetical protein GCM10010965_15980 [Caldalkalibacillus thermarum]|uniref:hypothetical protein n=1 Tax=Caldalkalibacillus thermarum TaxID=296745 RepID=UPI00166D2831|nr:hypothetical protein [Caldalkalibacillus thermarum]GGK24011.1 hypothetical protein GCM10010965_15980 [Caldalkalibacillus thermarum]
METHRELLQRLYAETCRIREQLARVHEDMNKNDPAVVEQLQAAVEARGHTIAKLQHLQQEGSLAWTGEEKELLARLKDWEPELNERLRSLYTAFARQLQKLNQGKQAAHKYQQPYAAIYTDGTYIDKRK